MFTSTKKIILSIALTMLSAWSHPLSAISKYTLNAILPWSSTAYCPSFSFFYQGISFHSLGGLEFTTKHAQQDFYLIVAQDLQIPQDIEINNLQTKQDSCYRWWHITSGNCPADITVPTTLGCVWQAQELGNKQAVLSLPINSIILLWDDPYDIAELKVCCSPANDLYCILPSLVFKNSLTLESFKQKLYYMDDVSMNLKFCHLPNKKVTLFNKNNDLQVITMSVSSNKYITL